MDYSFSVITLLSCIDQTGVLSNICCIFHKGRHNMKHVELGVCFPAPYFVRETETPPCPKAMTRIQESKCPALRSDEDRIGFHGSSPDPLRELSKRRACHVRKGWRLVKILPPICCPQGPLFNIRPQGRPNLVVKQSFCLPGVSFSTLKQWLHNSFVLGAHEFSGSEGDSR